MRETHLLGALLLVTLSVAPTTAGWPEITIDCDKNQSLQKAVDELDRLGGGRVLVTGTCVESLYVGSRSFIEIVGDSAVIQSPNGDIGTAVTAADSGYLELSGVRLTGGYGVHAIGGGRVVILSDCEIDAELIGIRAESAEGILTEDCDIQGVMYAIRVTDSAVVVNGGSVHDSDFAARVLGGKLFVNEADVTNNARGISALDRSDVEIVRSRFANNGNAHTFAHTGSRLTLYNCDIGGPTDPTQLSVVANDGAAIAIVDDEPGHEFWGSMTIHGDSYVSIWGTTVHGSVVLREFSRLVLEATVTDGNVGCGSAADAWCGPTASAASHTCPGIPTGCVPDQASTGDEPGALPAPDPPGLPVLRRPVSSTLEPAPAPVRKATPSSPR